MRNYEEFGDQDFFLRVALLDKEMKTWLEQQGIDDWIDRVGLTISHWEDNSPRGISNSISERQRIIKERWIELDDPSIAVLFKLRWGHNIEYR